VKGIIFNLLESFIVENWGEKKYENIIGKSELITTDPFVGPVSYPDFDIIEIIKKTAVAVKISEEELLMRLGRYCIPKLKARYPVFFERHKKAKDFLKTVDYIHYVEVVKLYKDATPPHFECIDLGENKMTMIYHSQRQLCSFMMGLVEGVGDLYNEQIIIKKDKCTLKGDDYCEVGLIFK
jgi:hypothetical protein